MSITNYRGSSSLSWTTTSWQQIGRLVIRHQTSATSGFVGEVRALFNPNNITLTGGASVDPQLNLAPDGEGVASTIADYSYQPLTLSVTLLFDTSEAKAAGGGLSALFGGGAGVSGASVLEHTTRVSALLRPPKGMTRPPLCQLWWGQYQILQGVLTSLVQNFTHFMPDGTPVRATLTCTFTEVDESEVKLTSGPSSYTSYHIVMIGDSLTSIAAERYGSPARWRDIALANGITKPRLLIPGTFLKIPK